MSTRHLANLILLITVRGKYARTIQVPLRFYFGEIMKHGLSKTRIYKCWDGMKERCYNPNRLDYKSYGGRGIKVCTEWLDKEVGFKNFLEWAMNNGYTDDLTLDRKDVNGNYEPSNCRWANKDTQANNRRNNHLLTYNGKTQTVAQWSKELQINSTTIWQRIRQYDYPEDEILSKPIKHRRYITYNGETKTLRQWSLCTGISYSTLRERIYKWNWDIEKSLTTR